MKLFPLERVRELGSINLRGATLDLHDASFKASRFFLPSLPNRIILVIHLSHPSVYEAQPFVAVLAGAHSLRVLWKRFHGLHTTSLK